MQPEKAWIEQCEATRGIEAEFGTQKAVDYLVGEKFLNFLQAAETSPHFRGEIPALVAEIKTIFEPWQLAEYLEPARSSSCQHRLDKPEVLPPEQPGKNISHYQQPPDLV